MGQRREGEPAPLGEITEAHFDAAFHLNARGTLFTVQKALPLFNDGGSILMTGSNASLGAFPGWSVYAGSKAVQQAWARVWLNELKDRRIRVNVLTPGQVATAKQEELFDEATKRQFESLIPRGQMGRPDEIATAALPRLRRLQLRQRHGTHRRRRHHRHLDRTTTTRAGHRLSNISIIGTGNMARTIAARAIAGAESTVEVMGRDHSKAADLAEALGGGATTGEWGTAPAGDIVIVALLYDGVVPVVAQYGDALAGKVIVDISNPFNSTFDGLAHREETSIAQEVAKAAPASASVVKAFNTTSAMSWRRVGPTSSSLAIMRRPRQVWRRSSEPRAAPAGRRRPENGALAGRSGRGHGGPRQPRAAVDFALSITELPV